MGQRRTWGFLTCLDPIAVVRTTRGFPLVVPWNGDGRLVRSVPLRPNPFQRQPEFSFVQGSCQVSRSKEAADPLDLKLSKDQGERINEREVELNYH